MFLTDSGVHGFLWGLMRAVIVCTLLSCFLQVSGVHRFLWGLFCTEQCTNKVLSWKDSNSIEVMLSL